MAKKIKPGDQTRSNQNQPVLEYDFQSEYKFRTIGIFITILLLTLAGSMDNVIEKWTGLVSAAAILVLLMMSRKKTVLRDCSSPLFYSVAAYIIWGGISTFYAASGKLAIFEFSKLLVAFCVYMTVLFITNHDQAKFKTISFIISAAGALYGFISVDAASNGILSKLFRSVIGIFTKNLEISQTGLRVQGIFGNANTYAGFMALAILLSLYLVLHAASRKEQITALILLAVNALSYLLAFSLGSIFIFFISCIAMIALTEKGNRVPVFLLMLETAIIAFLFAFIALIGLGKSGPISYIADLSLILSAALLALTDLRFRSFLSDRMNSNRKYLAGTILLLIILVSGYLSAAFLVSGKLTLDADTEVSRAIYVPAGEYSLIVKSSAPVDLLIESQNDIDLMRHTSSILYSGNNAEPISFQVPEHSKIVMIQFSAADKDLQISGAEYTGTASGQIHLNYPLLPEIMANRLQNLLANENLVQRTIFFQDGIKLFTESPVIGRGLGGFENGVYTVQDFYYQTKYTHNHYIQVLCDLGIIGFLFFISILIASVAALVSARRKARALFAVPVLAACLVQMFGQALTDAIWSTGVFLGFAAAILALVTGFCSEPVRFREGTVEKRAVAAERLLLAGFAAVFVLLLSGNLYAQAQAKAGVENFDDIRRLIALDRFEYNDYKLSFINNAPKSNSEKVLEQAQIYADELSRVESNSLAPYIADFRFKTYYDSDAYDYAKQSLQQNRSNPAMWRSMFDIIEENIDPVGPNVQDAADRLGDGQYYIDGVVELYQLLLERNKNSLDTIMLTPANQAFIGKCLEIQATHLYSVDWVFTAMMSYAFDSVCAVDADQDGIPDSLTMLAGDIRALDNKRLSVSDDSVMELVLYHKLHGKYRLSIETTVPQQGLEVTYNEIPLSVRYEEDLAFVEIDLGDNSNKELSTFVVSFPAAAEIKSITFITELET